VLFYIQVSDMLPEKFCEQLIRIYSKRTDEDGVATAFAVFQAVCRQYGLLPSKVCLWSFFNSFYQLPNAIVYRSQFKFFSHCPLLFEEML
jgi:hypothetical protein